MRTQLYIGEAARLLDITPKTIRHYQKVGLLEATELSTGGYRLFDAQDVLRLQQIRRLQTYGLSLKQIKHILGTPQHAHSLREVLQSLDQELAQQIRELEERRAKIQALLSDEYMELPVHSPTLELVKDVLGEQLEHVSPQAWELEIRVNTLLDGFDWQSGHQTIIQAMLSFFSEHPDTYQCLLDLNEGLAHLASEPVDSPAVEALLDACEQTDTSIRELLAYLMASMPAKKQMEQPLSSILSELMRNVFSPAQQRFLTAFGNRYVHVPAARKEAGHE